MHFPDSYDQARAQFRYSVTRRGARLHQLVQPGLSGAAGELLSIDVACVGGPRSEAAAIVFTGVHGAEAACGSAVLQAWLEQDAGSLPDISLVLVHAVNPWGYSHGTRTTENNVDLNRNFRTDWGRIDNPSYDLLHPYYHAPMGAACDSLKLYAAYKAFLDRNGWRHEADMTRGQTGHPDGLYFAGHQPEWGNLAVRKILQDHLRSAKRVGFLDIHTGMGEFGDIIHLIFAPEGSNARRLADSWWQRGGPAQPARYLPGYEGLLCHAIQQELPHADVAGAVLEFGVADAYSMFRSDRLDRWLRFEGRDDPDHAGLLADYLNSCTPVDRSWRRLVLREGPAAINRLIFGVAGWSG